MDNGEGLPAFFLSVLEVTCLRQQWEHRRLLFATLPALFVLLPCGTYLKCCDVLANSPVSRLLKVSGKQGCGKIGILSFPF